MSHLDTEIMMRISHMDGEQKNDILNYILKMNGRHSTKRHRRVAMRQIRKAIDGQA